MKNLKLYRGISAEEFKLLSPKIFNESRATWKQLLAKRARGQMKFPNEMNHEVTRLAHVARLERQHFTDNHKIARSYAKKTKGMLVEIEVPIEDTLKHFRLEFQNFGLRKKNFEIVYVIESRVLTKNQSKWKLKTRNL